MQKIKEAIVVEGTYDQIKLSGIIDAVIVKTDGFDLLSNPEKLEYIRTLAKKCGIVVLTDSDRAGFIIRSYIRGSVEGRVLHAYIPDIKGKEKRKKTASKEGLLGVEGISADIIINALKTAGCTFENEAQNTAPLKKVTTAMLYDDGLSGREDSAHLRRKLLSYLSLPARLSTSALLKTLNTHFGYDKYKEALEKIKE